MKRQTLFGFVFLLIGLFLLMISVAPVLVALKMHEKPPELTTLVVVLICIGLGTALFGAFLMPSSGAPTTFNNLMISLGRTNLPFVGGRKTTEIAAAEAQPPAGPTP